MGSINLGPFAFPTAPLLLVCAALIAATVGNRIGAGSGADVESRIWRAVFVGVLSARIAFVAAHFDDYRGSFWDMVNIRDGGFHVAAGFLAGLAFIGWHLWRGRGKRKPLALAALAGMAVWLSGVVATTVFYTGAAEVPEVTLQRLDGTPVDLKTLAGKPMVVNLWASWCPPCRREMPVLRDAQARERDVVFVFANQGEPAETVRRYLATEGLVIENVLLDPRGQLGNATGSRALPTTLFVDAKGRIVDRRLGELSSATLSERIQSLRSAL